LPSKRSKRMPMLEKQKIDLKTLDVKEENLEEISETETSAVENKPE